MRPISSRTSLALLFISSLTVLTMAVANGAVYKPAMYSERAEGRAVSPTLLLSMYFGLMGAFVIALAWLARQTRTRLAVKRPKKPSILSYLAWALLFVAVAYIWLRGPGEPRVGVANLTSETVKVQEGSRWFSRLLSNESRPLMSEPLISTGRWALYLGFLPVFAIAVLVMLHLTSAEEVPGEFARPEISGDLPLGQVRGSARERIVGLYRNAVVFLIRCGFPYSKSWTHREHELRVKESGPGVTGEFSMLTGLFEKAKYSPRPVNSGEVRAAYSAYQSMIGGFE